MKFSRKTVPALLACAMAVAFSGAAQAQECIAQVGSPSTVRAEALTGTVGPIQLRCNAPRSGDGVGFTPEPAPTTIKVAIQLNTNITNTIDDDRVVAVLADSVTAAQAAAALHYLEGSIHVAGNKYTAARTAGDAIAASVYGDGELSDDGTTIEWELATDVANTNPFNMGTDISDQWGFSMTVSGIRANAAAIGDGNDITANVMVGDSTVNAAPLKAADVTTGLDIDADDLKAASGAVCNDGKETATFVIQEGFASAIRATRDTTTGDNDDNIDQAARSDSIMVTVTGVPDGVKVTVPATQVGDLPATTTEDGRKANMNSLELSRRTGRTSGADKDGVLDLSTAGAGSVIYDVVARSVAALDLNGDNDTTDPGEPAFNSPDNARDDEKATLTVTFEWDGGDVDLGSVMLWVSYNPVSSDTGDSFSNGGPKLPRFAEDGASDTILTISDCKSDLFYPYVTSDAGYDTGIVVSNTAKAAGDCTATYSGTGAPEDPVDIGEVMPGMQSIFLLSSHVENFTGYLTVNCTSESASGFAHVIDTSGLGGSQGYIAQQPE